MAGTRKLLSIDGGGIRGIIPAMLLAEIEERTGRPIAELFDLIAGTSTGGILALGLTAPGPDGKPRYAAADGIQLYEREGPRIFSRSIWHKIHSVWNVEEEKYPSDGLEAVLLEYFGEARLKDALTEVLITSYEIERRVPFFFKSRRARDPATPDYDFPMRQVAQATAAAPTYFEPLKIEAGDRGDYYALVDGGVFAHNPGMCGFAEMKVMFPDAQEYLVVSLGTGELTRPLPYHEAVGWGLRQWAQPIIGVIFDGVSDTVHYQLQQMLPEANYYRFQARLIEGNDDMDDASRTNLRALRLIAESLIRENDEALTALCARL
jgi:patatin-like phospholipase/acyl hydrolase